MQKQILLTSNIAFSAVIIPWLTSSIVGQIVMAVLLACVTWGVHLLLDYIRSKIAKKITAST